ncbi:putative virus X resistance protein-like, coiled-coil [Helianthus annuus]|nr:putative virus X resistance protein-like, coiled-coil [Helianthus annuus]
MLTKTIVDKTMNRIVLSVHSYLISTPLVRRPLVKFTDYKTMTKFCALHSYLILSTLLSSSIFRPTTLIPISLLTMAETLANELLKVLVKKMTDEAFKRVARAHGIYNELKELKKTLSRIQDLLQDASQKEVTHKSVKEWLNALQHLAYDIDDVLDDVATEAMHRELTLQEPAASTSKSGSGIDVSIHWPPKLCSLGIGGLKKPISEWGDLNFPTSLVDLTLYGEPHVKNFSHLSHLFPSSLASLLISEFDNLESISTGLQHLTSLQHLFIWRCPKVNDLPESLLPSLLSLGIYGDCPKLKERCKGRGSHYWPRISHIPCIHITD